jgi:leader peptidase (prepilin peptidase)/N-methyltransferase
MTVLLLLLLLAAAAGLTAYAARRDLGVPAAAIGSCLALSAAAAWTAHDALGIDWRTASVVLILLVVCGLIAEIDRRFHIIPDALVAAVLALALCTPWLDPYSSLIGAAGVGAMFWSVRAGFSQLGSTDALGWGDVKLAAAIGAFLGPSSALLAVATASAVTAALLSLRLLVRTGGAAVARGAPLGVALAAALFVAALTRALAS